MDISSEARTTGLKLSIFGYMSSGDSVPEVRMTEANLAKTGRMASEASRQHSCMTGSAMCGVRGAQGSVMTMKPTGYVASSVAKSATSCSGEKSSVAVTCRVRSSELSRE